MPVYTYSKLKSDVNGKIKGKIGILVDARSTLNAGAREVFSQIDLKTSRRRAALVPNLFKNSFQYAAPTDLKGYAVINIQPQTDRKQQSYSMVPSEQFYSRPYTNTIAVDDHDFITKLLINTDQPNTSELTVSYLDSLTAGGGTWAVNGGATNLRVDDDNFVTGRASLRFDLDASSNATAGIQNSTLNSFDASDFFGGDSALFVWVWITSATNLTNFILQIGSGASNYYQKTTTTGFDGTAFQTGWNLLKFDLTNLSTPSGTPVTTACTFISLYMTKDLAKVSETDYRFNGIVIKKGEPNNITYYSKYAWQNSSGTYLENSTADSDYLNVDMDEYNLVLLKCAEFAAEEADEEMGGIKVYRGKIFFNPRYEKFVKLQQLYEKSHPSEAMNMISTVADFIRV